MTISPTPDALENSTLQNEDKLEESKTQPRTRSGAIETFTRIYVSIVIILFF